MDALYPPEVWLRGPLEGFEPWTLPIAHSLLQVREELRRLVSTVPADMVWARPGGAASIGFHIRHTAGALDRLLTYARGERLSEAQLRFLRREAEAGESLADLAQLLDATIDAALAQLQRVSSDVLFERRVVGRAELPSTVLGLIVHAAEHSTRHLGQAITTARILSGMTR